MDEKGEGLIGGEWISENMVLGSCAEWGGLRGAEIVSEAVVAQAEQVDHLLEEACLYGA